ncbi:hypothetical protein E2C01_071567 [Portunus trituberculatus]|uniref:Uncharacterized protein n=1 Tax=Portunus trituberculatus TaxID=210409 RepID=A0A5B7I096_PORTR|nr:hypothetical protein [Portunus trituberculatus]
MKMYSVLKKRERTVNNHILRNAFTLAARQRFSKAGEMISRVFKNAYRVSDVQICCRLTRTVKSPLKTRILSIGAGAVQWNHACFGVRGVFKRTGSNPFHGLSVGRASSLRARVS